MIPRDADLQTVEKRSEGDDVLGDPEGLLTVIIIMNLLL